MSLPVRRHPEVERDILDIAAGIGMDSRDAAFRFLDAVEATVSSLGFMPEKGSLKTLRDVRLRRVRSWAVKGFPKHLILYEARSDHVWVHAVVHGSRRYQRLLRSRL